jgi:nucleotide sugar dehydrogenase
MTKLYENVFRAVNIALANELADISGVLQLDAMEVIEAASTKPYGFMPFFPGPGVGGQCIPCDPHYLLWQLRASHATAPLIGQAMENIAIRPLQVVNRAVEALAKAGRSLDGARVLLAGVSYKPGVADLRESPALTILSALAERGAQIAYHDPLVPQLLLPGGRTVEAVVDPSASAYDLVVAHTLHPGVDYEWIADQSLVVDATYRLQKLPRSIVA